MVYITITGVQFCFGIQEFKVGKILHLEKEEDNEFDAEAILVLNDKGMQLGHVANSVKTVAKGTHSAGWISSLLETHHYAKVLFIVDDTVIAQMLEDKEIDSYN